MTPKAGYTLESFTNYIRAGEPTYSAEKYLGMDKERQRAIFSQAMKLMAICSKLGPVSALELLISLGSWLNEQPEVNA